MVHRSERWSIEAGGPTITLPFQGSDSVELRRWCEPVELLKSSNPPGTISGEHQMHPSGEGREGMGRKLQRAPRR